ncbi:MAG: hypothetical protein SNJ56_05805 [Termitinemataceae bacterium]
MKQCLAARLIAVFFLLFAALYVSSPGMVYAKGQQDDPLATADNLIAERKYNEAILVLTQFIKSNPERFDDAQKRLQRIVRLREEYNKIADDLLTILVTDPTNDERKLAMIRQLESLEAAPNRAAREFILKTKETALFTYNRAQFEKIMAEGKALIDKGDYIAAARRYASGFSLYREEFYQAGYGELIENRVNQGLADIEGAISAMADLMPKVQSGITVFLASNQQAQGLPGLEAITAAYQNLEPLLLEYANIRNRVVSIGRAFETQFLLLQSADATLGDSSFLPFAFRFILGRKTEVQFEGIAGSFDTFWVQAVNRIQEEVALSLDRQYQAVLAT